MKYIIGNWKMNKDIDDAIDFLNYLKSIIDTKVHCSILIAPPIIHLPVLSNLFSGIDFVSQNIAFDDFGAYTGEVSAKMVKKYVHYSLVGHSERRQHFHENNQILYQKILMCLKYKITPILCVGESKNDRDSDNYFSIIEEQLKETLMLLNDLDLSKLIVAYEPVWAIGTGKTAALSQISEVHNYIRQILVQRLDNSKGNKIPILYGGSCNASNTSSILVQNNVDGLLVGGASLDINHFKEMIKIAYGLSS